MHLLLLTSLLFQGIAMASRLYASSYDGKVSEMRLSKSGANYDLNVHSTTNQCGTSPSWLMPDGQNGILYCLDEAVDLLNATLTSFKPTSNGSLARIEQLETLAGPVASAFYTPMQERNRQFFAVAHYSGSAVSTYSVDPINGLFTHSQTFTFTMSSPGPVPSRQDAAHPHDVLVDPTGRFVLVPDLGADVVRIFLINSTTGHLDEQQPLTVSPGSGPRHGVFWVPSQTGAAQIQHSRFYLVTELDNSIRGYNVRYSHNGTMLFSQSYEENTYGGSTPPTDSKAAEIAISPENDHLVVSNRGDSTFGPGTDSIAVFSLAGAADNPNPSFVGLYPAYGSFPRHFQFSPDGDMLAIALQNSRKVAVAGWDRENGAIGPLLEEVVLDGDVTAVVWNL
ncbi:Lactonase, 7-bladed beta-propeller-domain-containing protein [Aspergillus aurantiobrunneus]